jgi:hypothetical protein
MGRYRNNMVLLVDVGEYFERRYEFFFDGSIASLTMYYT